jgi:hypothetical protein
MIITIWYVLGVLINSHRVKSSAIEEFYQIGGTALLTVLIVALLTTFSSAFFNILGSTTLLNPTTTNSLCHGIEANSQLNLLKGPFMSGPTDGGTSPFPGLCNIVDPSALHDLTSRINYPLAATGVMIANLTNQTANNLDDAFIFDSFIGFLSKLSPRVALCIDLDPASWVAGALSCTTPLPTGDPVFELEVLFTPYAGYEVISRSLATFSTLLTNAFTLFVAQLVFIAIGIFVWPYLIFLGLVLRSTPFTRGIGGLMIAIAIGIVLLYPTVFALEYLAMGNGVHVESGASTYGYNYITQIPGRSIAICPGEVDEITGKPLAPSCGGVATATCSETIPYNPICVGGATPTCPDIGTNVITPTCNYTVNFFAQPRIKNIAWQYKCWPVIPKTGVEVPLNVAEFTDIATLMIPFYSVVAPLIALIWNHVDTGMSTVPPFPLPFVCNPADVLKIFYDMVQLYGIIGITAYLLPILNLIIALTGALGVSGLLGGDTNLAGIARLL